jgi:hypothetical protein
VRALPNLSEIQHSTRSPDRNLITTQSQRTPLQSQSLAEKDACFQFILRVLKRYGLLRIGLTVLAGFSESGQGGKPLGAQPGRRLPPQEKIMDFAILESVASATLDLLLMLAYVVFVTELVKVDEKKLHQMLVVAYAAYFAVHVVSVYAAVRDFLA